MLIILYMLQYIRLATLFNILWSVIMAAHWLVTGALFADLYRKYCNDKSAGCTETDRKFTVLIVMSFICAGGWVSTVCIYCMYYRRLG